MSWYKIGTIATINGSKIITGAGTQFTNPLNGVSAGRMLLLPAAGTVQIYEIESVQSDTQLTLVSAYAGTTGSGKLYAIPTSPAVSIEQFAHEFASTLAYYQQQLQGWQSILTGTGNITLTTPDGQTVTVRSQSEWDRLLDTKMGAGQFGWGGRPVQISNVDILDYFKGAVPSGLYQCDSSTVTGLPPGFGPSNIDWRNPSQGFGVMEITDVTNPSRKNWVVLMNGNWQGWVSDIISHGSTTRIPSRTIEITDNSNPNAVYVIEYGAMTGAARPCYIDWHTDGSPSTDYNVRFTALPPANVGELAAFSIHARDLELPGMKGFVRNARALEYSGGGEFGEFLKSQQSAGSVVVGGGWRSFLSVRHRGGNANLEPSADSTQWGWALVDNDMTSGNFNDFVLEKTFNGTWLPAVTLRHTGNTTVDANGFLKTASPIVKLFSDGSSELNAESGGVVTTRLSEGVYHITGCLGLNADRSWGGVDGGITGPRCRNGLERLWIDYDIDADGSIVIRTYHRTHPSAMTFARNELKGYEEGDAIDIPTDTFLSIRVQMPARDESQHAPATRAISHSNVYCNSVSPT